MRKLFLLLLLLASNPVFAQTPVAIGNETPLVVYGVGTTSCGSYLAVTANVAPGNETYKMLDGKQWHGDSGLVAQWVHGFVTSWNIFARNAGTPQETMDYAAIDQWIRNWCQANPTETVFMAAMTYIGKHSHAQAR